MINENFAPNDITLVVSTCSRGTGSGAQSYTTSNSRTIRGWTSVRVTRGIEHMPADFEVSFTERYPGTADIVVQPGDEVEVYLGSDLVLSGFVDVLAPSYDSQRHTIRVAGRSRSQDIVDCSCYHSGGQFLNSKVDLIAGTLCAPYGIAVNVADGTNIGAPISQYNVMAGETPYNAIELICRFRALLFYDLADGSMMIASGGSENDGSTSSPIGTRIAASGFSEGVNVESASVPYRMDGRFSDYDTLYQGLDTLGDVGNGGNLVTRVTDGAVQRFRYRVIISENITGGVTVAEQRAQWEMAARVGRSTQIRLTTDSWRDSSGQLYEPNILVDVDLPSLKLQKKRWLISEITYRRDETGTHADVTIVPPAAFYQEPIALFPLASDFNRVANAS